VVPLITAATGSSLVFVTDSALLVGEAGRCVIEEISRFGPVHTEDGQAIISLVGESLPCSPGLAASVFSSLDDVKIGMIHYGSSPITMNFLVAEAETEKVILRLHELLFDKSAPDTFK
jgi:aspartokinase